MSKRIGVSQDYYYEPFVRQTLQRMSLRACGRKQASLLVALFRTILCPACTYLIFATTAQAQSPGQLINNSSRALVRTGDAICIEEFAIEGSEPKQIIVRALGPSLTSQGMPNPLPDPTLVLYDGSGAIVASNDNWKDNQETEIVATGLAPSNDLESAIVATLSPGTYATALVDKNSATGIGITEVYDLAPTMSLLTATGTRANAQPNDELVLSGIIVGGNQSQDFLLRALGPSLTALGIGGALADPSLGLYDANGVLLAADDDWQDTQATEIAATGLAPTDDREAAILTTLSPSNYTIVETATPGVTFVETYTLPYGGQPLNPAPIPPVITSPLNAAATVNLPFSYQFEATGATSLSVGVLPDGVTFDPDLRAIVGSPKLEGTFQIDLSASNGGGTTTATLVLTIQPFPAAGPVVNSVTSATGRTGQFFRFQIATTGGSPATQLSVTGLPAGLSADPMTGEIIGTVANDGSFLVTLAVTDAGITNSFTLELTFTSDLTIPVIVSSNTALLFPNLPFLYTIDAPSSDSVDPIAYSKVGPLPPGLGLDQDAGIISGTFTLSLGLLPQPALAGGVVTNTQIFACNSHGCAAQGIYFLLPTGAANISTRLSVGTNDDVLIGGFITKGNAPSKLVVRGIGPSLPLSGILSNPFVELHNATDTVASNDNWKDDLSGGSQEIAIENSGLPPTNDLESAILAVLDPGSYTAIMRGATNGTGIGLIEVYNLGAASLDLGSEAHLANISTRGKVQTGDNVMIGGFINQGAVPMQVLIRGIGPSLAAFGVTGALADPILELHEPDGTVITNDGWMSDQKTAILTTGLAPTNDLEAAILITVPVGEGGYTAIVRGVNSTTGVGLVEAYFGDPCLGSSCP